jgi:hypothetical protein
MHASLDDSPDAPAEVGRQIDASVEQPSPSADRVRRDLILLVEDNAINMRVSPRHPNCDLDLLRPGSGSISMASMILFTLLPDRTTLRTNSGKQPERNTQPCVSLHERQLITLSRLAAHSPHEETASILRFRRRRPRSSRQVQRKPGQILPDLNGRECFQQSKHLWVSRLTFRR